jgi:hypothetical protein
MKTKNLIADLHEAANLLSYYNAAEGDCWFSERANREVCRAEFNRIREELTACGVDVDFLLEGHGYLI